MKKSPRITGTIINLKLYDLVFHFLCRKQNRVVQSWCMVQVMVEPIRGLTAPRKVQQSQVYKYT